MKDSLFIVKSIELTPYALLEVLFDKNMNLEENVKCWFRIVVPLGDVNVHEIEEITYIREDQIIGIPELVNIVEEMLHRLSVKLEAINNGINLMDNFYIETPGTNSDDLEVERDIRKSIENLDKYKIESLIITIYTSTLVYYKGTDTLQKRKFKKMIESQEDAMRYYNSGGRYV